MSATTLICLLDKTYPPHHAFVTGFLADSLPRREGFTVQMIVGQPDTAQPRVVRYYRAVCLNLLPRTPRSLLWKVAAFGTAIGSLLRLARRARRRGHRVTVLVRNDPMLLIAASILRCKFDHLVFQNSFPLEETHGSPIKRAVHRALYRLGGRNADGLLCVSPLGLTRAARYVPEGARQMFVPLLPDFESTLRIEAATGPVRFIYLGTHDPSRRLATVVAAAIQCLSQGAAARFTFVGGKAWEIAELERVDGVGRWQQAGLITFVPQVSRTLVPSYLADGDVGISAVPNNEINREMSPTKLAEYMGAGLAVVASEGVLLQDQMLAQSGGGLSCAFSVEALSKVFQSFAADRAYLKEAQRRALAFATQHLSIAHYTPALALFLSGKAP